MSVACHRILGKVPPTADRSVIFFANLQSIFFENEEETQALADTVHGLESYGGRLIPILNLLYPGGDNLLVLERRPADVLLDWFQEQLALELPSIADLRHRHYQDPDNGAMKALADQLKDHRAPWLDGYVTDKRLADIAATTAKSTRSTRDASISGNNKYRLHQFLESANLPVFETHVAETQNEVKSALSALHESGYENACAKAAIGASGIGLQKLATSTPNPTLPSYFFDFDPCLIQGWLDENNEHCRHVESPSVQLWLDDNHIYLYDLTNQILSADSVHEGNAAPPDWQQTHPTITEDILSQAEQAADWLHNQGYRGAGSIDFHLQWQDDAIAVARICEINARVTGATYPSILARKLAPGSAWRMQNLHFPTPLPCEQLLNSLLQSGAAFRPGDTKGLIPINANLDADGLVEKCQLLAVAPEREGCLNLLSRLESILPVEFLHDRD